ncbi:MAG: M20/M25/M40 family metallo-hydrolase [Robiginitomaculum sp.]|nr:M20/M25/M40 family metallo-hydrolase [Robiginitomaculum sp.]
MYKTLFVSLMAVILGACATNSNSELEPLMAASGSIKNIHHKMQISIQPNSHAIEYTDEMTIPAKLAKSGLQISINNDLQLAIIGGDVKLKLITSDSDAKDTGMDRDNDRPKSVIRLNVYELIGLNEDADNTIIFNAKGKINNPVKQLGEEYARGFSSSAGLIEQRGVYLAGATYWLPTIKDELITYEIKVKLPAGWSSVSQGELLQNEDKEGGHYDHWFAPTPTEEIYLIAAEFTQYQMPAGNVTAMAYLRTSDAAMANKYLETTAQYMEMYRQLVGPYPYTKFALVENFWETGYGMPSFTLLGSQIIRFPFILHSSYPHELLHNWWGNSVYIDFETGNWAEGLTAYMADHLVAEQRGKGEEYRRATLQRYTNYVDETSDFALNDFIGRTNASTEAVGYGKTGMVFNMLRTKVGDENFKRALQKFYRDHKYAVGSWNDIRLAFEAVSDTDLTDFFNQWVGGVGAAELEIVSAGQDADRLKLVVRQIQKTNDLDLTVPILVYTKDKVTRHNLSMKQRQQSFELKGFAPIVRVEIDPEFHLFRRLHWAEIPPSLGNAFGAENVMLVLPSDTSPEMSKRYTKMASIWGKRENFEVVNDNDLSELPSDRAIWIFGLKNKFANVIAEQLSVYDAQITDNLVRFGERELSLETNSSVIVVRNPNNPKAAIVGITAHSDNAVAGLARKLPHYGKYSYLAFEGDDPTNSAKGEWPAIGSPLVAILDKNDTSSAKIKPRPALAELKPVFDAKRLMNTVTTLSGQEYQGRGVGTKGLDLAADYIRDAFISAGIKPADGSYFQEFSVTGPDGTQVKVKNVVGIIQGSDPAFAGQSVVLSAHYDHLGFGWPDVRSEHKGKLHPGADDNASGVAVMLEVAISLAKSAPKRSIILLASTAEESGLLGAYHYIKTAKDHPKAKVFANVNLDTVGNDRDGFLIFGGSTAREWPFIFMGTGATTGIKTTLVKQAVNASDHTAFIEANIPAIHIFGSASGTYHRPSDTGDQVSLSSLMKATGLTKEVVQYLAGRVEPMTNQIKPASGKTTIAPAARGERRASTGSRPDFSYNGSGIKIDHVADNSAGANAGLKVGDVITIFGGQPVSDLPEYSAELRKYQPGDKVTIIVERNGKTKELNLVLGER